MKPANVLKSKNAVHAPRPASGRSVGKRKNSKNNINNFFIKKNKTLFLNEDDVDTYITYPPKPDQAENDDQNNENLPLVSPSNFGLFNENHVH